jgi:pilus assembly protein CpaC
MTMNASRTTHSELESEDLNMLAAHTTQFWRSRPLQGRRPAAFFAALVVYIIVILVAAPQAQQPQVFNPTGTASATVVRDAVSGSEIDLMVGRSTVLNVGAQIARVSLTVPDIADALVTAPSQLLIHGKKPGTISMFVWDKAGAISTFEVKVRHDLSALLGHLKQLFPGEDITVLGSGKDVVLSGTVSSKYVIEKAGDMAAGYVAKKDDVVNMLKQQEGVASNQVMLRVRFAEVSRSAMQELGVNFIANGSGTSDQWFGRTNAGTPGPSFSDGKLVFSDFLNLFVFNAKEQLGAVVKALSNKGLFQSLAEPNLIATNGKEASFLAGGEYPYPVVQSGSGTNSVTITFKEFGVRLSFTPTVLGGDLIHLKVKPEVSSLDFANAVVIDGFRVPALSTRRTETEVELRDGQTFAIAGLMNNTLTNSMSKIPGIGDIPVLGLLFRSKAHQKNQTELVVMITPTIIRKGQMGVSEGLPSLVEPYLGRPDKTYPNPDPFTGSARYPADQPQPREGNGTAAPRTGTAQQTPASSAPVTTPAAPPAQKATPTATTPVPSKPISQTAPVAAQPAARPATATTQTPPVAPTPAKASAPAKPAATAPAPAAKAQSSVKAEVKEVDRAAERAAEKAREQERKAAEAEAKQKAEEDKVAQAKAEEDRRQADRLAKDRAKREAEIARKNAEVAKKQADDDAKREKALAEAAARLKQAQTAYQAEVEKTKGGSNDKSKEPGKS